MQYWGVRGSIPSPGPSTVRYGGNTTCLSVHCGEQLFIIDAGSGIRPLGSALLATGRPIAATVLFSHLHWDHIQGFPFFMPAFTEGNKIRIWSAQRADTSLIEVLKGQMAQPTFPVTLEEMAADITFHEMHRGEIMEFGNVTVRTAPLNHPGGATAFRFEYRGRSFVHASDHEHQAELHAPLLELAHGADYLSYDSTYTTAEYEGGDGQLAHEGWGHSTWAEAIRMANRAQVGMLVLFHHDPDHTDDIMDGIVAEAQAIRANTIAAKEGLVLGLL